MHTIRKLLQDYAIVNPILLYMTVYLMIILIILNLLLL